jgi:hypothetical protein
MMIQKTCTAAVVGILVSSGALMAQDKPTLTPDDYDQWERLGAGVLSPNGAWMAVSIDRVSDEGELRIHSTTSDSVVIVPFGSRPIRSGRRKTIGMLRRHATSRYTTSSGS